MLDLIDDELPERVVPYGYKSHPMYKQWLKMMDSCTDPTHPLYPQVGAKGITVMHRWFDFTKFIEDNEGKFDNEPSRPARLRKAYISRRNPKAGFNPSNLVWVTKREAVAVQPKTVIVDTIFGKGWPLKRLAQYLQDHAGEDLPEGARIYRAWVRRYNPGTGKLERELVPVTTVQPIKLHELRRRHRLGLDLLAPVREYGQDRIEEEREAALCAQLDQNRKPIPADAPFYVKNRGFV
jgi:hypothetical protein